MNTFLFGDILIKGKNLRELPLHVRIWPFLMVFVPILCIPAYAVYKLIITPGRDFDEVDEKRKKKGKFFSMNSLVFSVFNEQ